MRDQLGVAVLGCGYWGMNYVRVFSELPGARVLLVCDKRADRLQDVGRRFPGVILTTDVEHALAVTGVDAVVICTEASTHHRIGRRALQAGKHVLMEKPLATTAADADDLMAVAEEHQRTLMVGHTFIYNTGIRKIKEYIDQGEVGRVYYLYSSRTNLGPIRRDVNALWDLAPHDVAIFNYLLDSTPEWVSAVGVNVLRNRREDVGFVSLGYPNGVVGHVHVSWADPNKVRELVVVGSDKRIAFNDLNPLEQVRIYEKSVTPLSDEAASYGEYHFLMRDGNIISPRIEFSEPLKNQCGHFLEAATRGTSPLTDGAAGREVVRVMEAIDRSLRRRGAPVAVAAAEQRNGRGHRNGRQAPRAISAIR
ncbi:MAG: Gfo/Idh/MocA family oxidoreductase [Chloroflexota bacterium]|nr:Gfo/Idh/MocA family oxidoreductase [Chloroflexota bacterium]